MNTIEPKDYYYTKFREQFSEFVRKAKAHEHPGEGLYISIHDLNQKNLSHIPKGEYMLFHCALACSALIDQFMYTHFKIDYQKFQQMTMYPKIEYGITNINVSPWAITHSRIGLNTFKKFLAFFVSDLKNFFTKNRFEEATWGVVRAVMLSDKDVVSSSQGKILKRTLENEK